MKLLKIKSNDIVACLEIVEWLLMALRKNFSLLLLPCPQAMLHSHCPSCPEHIPGLFLHAHAVPSARNAVPPDICMVPVVGSI